MSLASIVLHNICIDLEGKPLRGWDLALDEKSNKERPRKETLKDIMYVTNSRSTPKQLVRGFLSEGLQHDVVMVYFIQRRVVALLKTKRKDSSTVEYFTDGCAAQYKNFKYFHNLCLHK